MAKPIEPTPVLTGKDAEAFLEAIRNTKYSEEKEMRKKRAIAAYAKYIEKKS